MGTLTTAKVQSRERIALLVITALNISRLPSVLSSVTNSKLPVYEWIPGWGDTFAGFLAILVFIALLRGRGLEVWTIAIIWNVYGMLDVINAAILRIFMPQIGTPYALPAGLFGPVILTTLHLINLFFLSRSRVLNYYFGPKYPA